MMEIVIRKHAILLGLKRYFTGLPCKYGHIAERMLPSGNCTICFAKHESGRYAANPAKILAKNRRWRINNPEKTAELQRKWRALNPERSSAIKKKWQDANPEKTSIKGRRWRLANKDRCLVHKHTRRTKEHDNGGRHTHQDIADILASQDGKCAYFAYCKTELTPQNKHIDHIMPIVAGGSNNRSNIQLLCRPCNCSKGARDPIIHCQSLGWLL
jgi:5-methylcytosine-specific restriction endonuclease McrA